MKQILFPIFLFFTFSHAHSKFVVLGEPRDWHEKNQMCWDSDGTFVQSRCAKKDFECTFKKTFNNIEIKDLFLSPPPGGIKHSENLNAWIPGFNDWSRNADTSQNPPWILKPGVPPGAEVTIYSNENNHFHIYGKFKAPVMGDIFLNPKISAYKKIIIKFRDDKKEKNEQIEGHILNTYFYPIKLNEGLEFTLAEGKYDMELVWFGKDKKRYSHNETFNIPKPTGIKQDKEPIVLELTSEHFNEKPEDVDTFKPLFWDIEQKTLGSMEYNSSYEDEIWGFESIQKLFLNGKDARNLFNVIKGQLSTKNRETFENEVKDPILNFEIEATCARYFKRYVHDSFSVFHSADDNSDRIGTLKIYTQTGKLMGSFFDSNEVEKDTSKFNIISNRYLIQRIEKVNGNFIDLGPGPWGKETWVKLQKNNKYLNKVLNSEDELLKNSKK